MELRAVREDEIDDLIDHMDLVFNVSRKRMIKAYREDSTVRLHQVRVVVEDGQIVSAVRVANRPVRIGGARVEMGGIGGVSTHPDYRGRGYCTEILKAQIEYMERQGYDISMLFTGICGFYRRLEWYCHPQHSAQAPVPEAVQTVASDDYTIRQYRQDTDLDGVIACYDQYNAERTLTMVRHRQYWLDGHTQYLGGVPWLVAERDGQIYAYVSGSPDDIHEACCRDGHLNAFEPLADYILQQACDEGVEQIRLRLHYNHPITDRYRRICGGRISHSYGEGMMLRVIRLMPLLTKVAPVFEKRLAEAGFCFDDRMSIGFEQVGQKATVVVEGSSVAVTEGPAELDLRLNGRQFFMLLCGAATVDELDELLTLEGNVIDEEYRALLRILFPRQPATYYGCDHF